MKALTLSIVIPAYNEETYLKSCLEAIAKQSVKPDQVIVVDNNSTDATARVAEAFSFVHLIYEKKQGLYHSRQTGMNMASGDLIARIDADTYIGKNWVKAIKKAFQDTHIQAASGPVGYHDMPFPNLTRKSEDFFLRAAKVGRYDFLMGANMVLRRTAWDIVKDEVCNESFLFEDIDIAIHLQEHGIFPAYLPTMQATVSSRRFEDKPADFMRYIRGHSRTHEYHGQTRTPGVYLAESAFALVYLGVKPFHMAYDPKLKRPSLNYLLKKRTARPDPMSVD